MTKRFIKLALTAAFGLALALTFSCSEDKSDSGGGNTPTPTPIAVRKEKVSGVSQKGPFVKGSSITLYELDSNLVQTGLSFQSTITDNEGSFEIKGISFISPYVRLKTDGFYYNEVSGKKSTSSITLYAIADLTNKSSMNVNLLTHLEHEKVQNLVESGKSFSEAKKQAQREILKTFGINGDFADSEDMSIFGTGEGSAILLAISVLLQGERDEASFTDLLTDFNQSIKNSSDWSVAKRTELADWAAGANFENIRANINGWGLNRDVPIFENYVKKFWSSTYGLDECSTAYSGKTAKNANPLSVNRDDTYVCNGSYWETAGNVSSSSETPSSSSSGCTAANNTNTQYCSNGTLKQYGSVTDNGGRTYKTVVIGDQTWMAENLNYNASNSRCSGDNTGGDSQGNCAKYGRLYNWATAMGISSDFNSDSYNPSSSTKYRGVCPIGWHIPNNAEWDKLMRYVDGTNGTSSPYYSPTAGKYLKAASGWTCIYELFCNGDSNGTDEFGFSALPGGFGSLIDVLGPDDDVLGPDGSFSNAGIGGTGSWWSASERNSDNAYDRYMGYGHDGVGYTDEPLFGLKKSLLCSVRCLQD